MRVVAFIFFHISVPFWTPRRITIIQIVKHNNCKCEWQKRQGDKQGVQLHVLTIIYWHAKHVFCTRVSFYCPRTTSFNYFGTCDFGYDQIINVDSHVERVGNEFIFFAFDVITREAPKHHERVAMRKRRNIEMSNHLFMNNDNVERVCVAEAYCVCYNFIFPLPSEPQTVPDSVLCVYCLPRWCIHTFFGRIRFSVASSLRVKHVIE